MEPAVTVAPVPWTSVFDCVLSIPHGAGMLTVGGLPKSPDTVIPSSVVEGVIDGCADGLADALSDALAEGVGTNWVSVGDALAVGVDPE